MSVFLFQDGFDNKLRQLNVLVDDDEEGEVDVIINSILSNSCESCLKRKIAESLNEQAAIELINFVKELLPKVVAALEDIKRKKSDCYTLNLIHSLSELIYCTSAFYNIF